MVDRYETRDAFEAAILEHLPTSGWSDELRREAATALTQAQGELADDEQYTSGLELRIGRWFIRGDDSPFFQTIAVLGPAVAAFIVTGGLTAPLIVGGAVSVLAAAWKTWRKGGRLSADQLTVLSLLRSKGPMTSQALEDQLRAAGEAPGEPVETILEQLSDVELADGSGVELAKRTPIGAWRAVQI